MKTLIYTYVLMNLIISSIMLLLGELNPSNLLVITIPSMIAGFITLIWDITDLRKKIQKEKEEIKRIIEEMREKIDKIDKIKEE